ncbi:lipase family protein [Pseudomonas sp. Teo4]|uniref:lipase family protein n=1 Tax=Pseudomonas sp. Teo4 TaxID=3064528 RepID=UPI002ACB0980|nr:lipase family protein [Pseudomonas sp. Teo4]
MSTLISASEDRRAPISGNGATLDPYYYVSAETLRLGKHGQLIKYKEIDPPAGLEQASQNFLAIYKSAKNDATNSPVAVSAVIALPKGKKPAGGWPIVSWAHGTVGSADKCAPSMDNHLIADTPALRLHKVINRSPHVMLNAFLDNGWAVVMTDYEGLGTEGPHPFLNGASQARSVLDAVRTARQLPVIKGRAPLFSRSFAVVGHSQGGRRRCLPGIITSAGHPNLIWWGLPPLRPLPGCWICAGYRVWHLPTTRHEQLCPFWYLPLMV